MAFKSRSQQRFMYAKKPKGVNLSEYAKNTYFPSLPEKVKPKKSKTKK